MANNKNTKNSFSIKNLLSLRKQVDDTMNDLYASTYSSSKQNNDDLTNIANDIETNIDSIISRNQDEDIGDLSRIYSRLKMHNDSDKDLENSIEELFGSNSSLSDGMLSLYMTTKWVKELDQEYDSICKYVPKMDEALSAKKDAILSSDNFSKDFVNAYKVSDDEKGEFDNNFNILKDKYKLQEKLDKYVDNILHYGEEIVYCVPYDKAIKQLLDRKSNTNNSIYHMEETLIESGEIINKDAITLENNILKKDQNLNISFDNGYIKSCMDNLEIAYNSKSNQIQSLSEMYLNESYKFDKTIDDDNLEYDSTTQDGIYDIKSKKENKIDVPGCVLKSLKHENILPIFIENLCLGYCYFEFAYERDDLNFGGRLDTYSTMSPGINPISKISNNDSYKETSDQMLRQISGYLSQKIDKSFINANQNLSDSIYMILKHNDLFNESSRTSNINVSFIPEEDIIHMAFNWDDDTHRGVSDLIKGLIPAKLYACLYITNTIGILTRGQDKRVYYVKQNVETNIAQSMLNVINQIKKSNFGIRQIENMNSILNITGRFNDLVIPKSQSGESPMDFEIMPGQQIDPKTELMQMLEEQAVNSTDVPIELIQARQSLDYAIQLTMSNTKFLRHIFKRQAICEYYFSKIFTKIYNYEYKTNIQVKCVLPTPLFLNMTNINQLIQNVKEYAEQIASYEYDDQNDPDIDLKKATFVKNLMRQKLSTYVKVSDIDNLKDKSDMQVSKMKNIQNDQ